MILIGHGLNGLRVCADLVHLLGFFLLIRKILVNRSCAGISGKTQFLNATVFTLRYLDLLTSFISLYNTIFKITFIALSYFILFLIFGKFRKTYDSKNDSFVVVLIILFVFLLTFTINYVTLTTSDIIEQYKIYFIDPLELSWTFSIYLEALAILPQLYMIRKTRDGQAVLPYVLALTVYRGIYVCNWIYRYLVEKHVDSISSVSGIIQTVLLVTVLINIQLYKERKPKWQEITEVFTVETAKLDKSEKPQPSYYINPSQNEVTLHLIPENP